MIPRGAETYEAFLRWMNEGGPRRSPKLYGAPEEAVKVSETPAPPEPHKAPPTPAPADRKSLAAGDDWDAAEIVEDIKEEGPNQ